MRITIVTGFFLPVPALSGGATERSWYGLAKIFASAGHEVTFVSRAWPTLPAAEIEAGVNHLRVRGFDHTRILAANLILDLVWGLRVARALPASRVAGAFQTVPAPMLSKLAEELDYDVLVTADSREVFAEAALVVSSVGKLRPLYAGPLKATRLVEALTPALLNVMKYNKIRPPSIKLV